MQLAAGTRLGPYEILAPIGAGGMGEVYKARDTRLDRIVAGKVSKEQFSERFEREARAVAALNHPGICTLYDVGPNYLVMEFIDGAPLKTPLPLDQALRYAIQICDALAAAHKKGITHRDLKPANILVTKSGIKLLDFGLAKLAPAAQPVGDETLTMALTGKNEIVGTLYYMSPEQLQAQGNDRQIDARSDIFTFGVVLYEMLTGKRAFDGANMASVIAAIMERPAPSISDIAPTALDQLLKTCLEKDPEERWQTARDLKRELERISNAPESTVKETNRLPWIAAGVLAAGLVAALWSLSKTPAGVTSDRAMMHVDIDAGPDEVDDPVISPDGTRLVFVVRGANGSHLATRRLDQAKTSIIPDTKNARYPFFSPDGKSIGFFSDYAGGRLKTVSLDGGTAAALADAPYSGGAVWSEDGTITVSFDQWNQGLFSRISASGGTPQPLTKREGVEAQLSPQYLPGGKGLLFTRKQGLVGYGFDACVKVPGRAEPEMLVSNAIATRYLPSGHLVFLRQQKIFAVRFDLDRMQTAGDAIPIVDDVWDGRGVTPFSISNTGVLAYRHGNSADRFLMSVDAAGKQTKLIQTSGAFVTPSISPDGMRVAFVDLATGIGRILIQDVTRGVTNRLTLDDRPQGQPSWTPDGTRVIFFGGKTIMAARADGGGQPEPVAGSEGLSKVVISSDGKLAAGTSVAKDADIWIATVEPAGNGYGFGKRVLLAGGPGRQEKPVFSPDRRFVAYMSNETGVYRVYVVSLSADGSPAGGKWQISKNGGYDPKWPAKGGAFYYGLDEKITVVPYTTRGDSILAEPGGQWPGQVTSDFEDAMFDVTPDGKHAIAIIDANSQKPETHVRLVLNFAYEVRRRLPNGAK
ncbi:MAG: hypothetical protein FJW38_21720 [Acidobacteria bacterium]|nr:hypothetical protein [Acidobacteriota bacterium]